MKISVANTKVQLIQTLEQILRDWNELGHIKSLINYCNNSTEFPYSQLRKMEKMGLIRSLSSSKRNKTYEWLGDAHPNLENIAQSIINYTGVNPYLEKMGIGLSHIQKNDPNYEPDVIKTESKTQDLTKLTIKIALILQKNDVSEDKIESITASILSLLE